MDNTERVMSNQAKLSMKNDVLEPGRFPDIPSHVCRPRTNGQSIFRPGSLSLVSNVMVCFGLSNFVSLQFTTAPSWRCSAPAGESQCLLGWPGSCRSYRPVVPLLISLGRYVDFQNLHTHNKALIGCFLLHYFHR